MCSTAQQTVDSVNCFEKTLKHFNTKVIRILLLSSSTASYKPSRYYGGNYFHLRWTVGLEVLLRLLNHARTSLSGFLCTSGGYTPRIWWSRIDILHTCRYIFESYECYIMNMINTCRNYKVCDFYLDVFDVSLHFESLLKIVDYYYLIPAVSNGATVLFLLWLLSWYVISPSALCMVYQLSVAISLVVENVCVRDPSTLEKKMSFTDKVRVEFRKLA